MRGHPSSAVDTPQKHRRAKGRPSARREWFTCSQAGTQAALRAERRALLRRVKVEKLKVLFGVVRRAVVRFAVVRLAVVRFAVVRLAVVRLAAVRVVLVRFAVVRLAVVRLAVARLDVVFVRRPRVVPVRLALGLRRAVVRRVDERRVVRPERRVLLVGIVRRSLSFPAHIGPRAGRSFIPGDAVRQPHSVVNPAVRFCPSSEEHARMSF